MFDPIATAKIAVNELIATKGYAAYRAAAQKVGFHSWRGATEAQALALCKEIGYGQMFASAKASGTTPAKPATVDALAALADDVYGKTDQPFERRESLNVEDDDVELNTHAPFPGKNAEIDPKEIYGRYNKPKTKRAS